MMWKETVTKPWERTRVTATEEDGGGEARADRFPIPSGPTEEKEATTNLLCLRRGPPLSGPCIPADVPTASWTRSKGVSATFRRPSAALEISPGEFLEPPRGFWNKHGDAPRVPAKTNTFQAKPAPVRVR